MNKLFGNYDKCTSDLWFYTCVIEVHNVMGIWSIPKHDDDDVH